VALLRGAMAVRDDALDRRAEELRDVDVLEAPSAGAPRELGLHLATRCEHGAAGHPGLPRRGRRAGGADGRIRGLDDDALHTELGASDLLADQDDPLPHLGCRRVYARDDAALVAFDTNACGREVVEGVRVADVLQPDGESD